ncbi:MAG: thioredoxin [Bacteroidota bacterium]
MPKASFNELINGEKAVLIDFHATWCGPCQALAPVLKEAAQDLRGQAKIIKIDIDKHPKLADQLKVRGVPTLILYRKGKQLWRQSGAMSKQQLLSALGPHL